MNPTKRKARILQCVEIRGCSAYVRENPHDKVVIF